MTEFDLIEQYFPAAADAPGVILGIGDDGAVLALPAGSQMALSVDTLVADVHFPSDGDPELIAERALRVAVSDLAAMGADPLWFTLAITLPNADPHWLESFGCGLQAAAAELGIALVGGDTTRGPLTLSLQVHGAVEPGKALTRSGAGVGDVIFVSGPLGDAAAALAVMTDDLKLDISETLYLSERYYKPQPQIALGLALRGIASAAIDVSDGLLQDLGHICRASGVGAVVEFERFPLSPALRQVSLVQAISWALAGGDDYQLCFTVPRSRLEAFEQRVAQQGFEAVAIGEIVKGDDVTCLHEGQVVKLSETGYQHFR